MLGWVKLINGVMSFLQFFGTMFRDEQLKQVGRDSVTANSVNRLTKAREKAHAKVQNFDDAIAVARGKLHRNSGDNR